MPFFRIWSAKFCSVVVPAKTQMDLPASPCISVTPLAVVTIIP